MRLLHGRRSLLPRLNAVRGAVEGRERDSRRGGHGQHGYGDRGKIVRHGGFRAHIRGDVRMFPLERKVCWLVVFIVV